MAASGFTPISLYYSTTASAVPTSGNLANGELGLNINDMKLYAKNSAGTVTLLASNAGASGSVTSVAATVPSFLSIAGSPITTSGTLAFTLSGTALPTTSGGTGLTSFTANGVVYASSSSALATGSALVFDGTNLSVGTTALSSGKFSTIADLTAVNGLVVRDSATTYANNDNFVLLQNSAGATAGSLTHPAASSLGVWGNDDIRFLQGSGSTEQMRLTSTGLGIGLTAPVSKLHLRGSSSSYTGGLIAQDGTGNYFTFYGNGNNGVIGTVGTISFASYDGSSVRFLFGASGQFGIGGATYGTSGQVLTSGGASAAPTWTTLAAGGSIDVQTFTSSGTWTKPSLAAGSRVLIQAWGAGGSGGKTATYGAGGGGGGGYKERWVTLSSMGATETITIGAGGTARTTDGVGNVGGSTTVGTLVTAYGGGGGGSGFQDGCGVSVTPGAGGAGMFGPGVNQTAGSSYWGAGGYPDGGGGPPRYDGTKFNTYLRMIAPQTGLFSYNMGNDAFSDTAGAGGGGKIAFTNDSGNSDRPTFNGGRAVWGGGGGGGTQGTAGGVSQCGGNGGAGGATGTVGTQPAGGGGGSSSGNSGAGGAGQVIITVFPA